MTTVWPAGIARELEPLPRSLGQALRDAAKRRQDNTAIIFYGLEIGFSTLVDRVERLAAFLQHSCGVQIGDRVLLDMQNSPHFVIAYHAIVRAGAVVVPVNPMSTASELAFLCDDSGARVALIGTELLDRFTELTPAPLRHMIIAHYADEVPQPAPFRLPPVMRESAMPSTLPDGAISWATALSETRAPLPDTAEPDDLCVMPYTSGTTGKPKACLHTHSSVLHTALAQARWYGLNDQTVLTGFMPLFHAAGMQMSLNGGIAMGITVAIMARWDRDLVAPLFKRYGVTVWSAAPTMVVDVLSAPDFDATAFDTLRIVTGGGAAMPSTIAAELERRWGLRFIEGYGLTETMSPTHLNPVHRPKPQCLGIPIQGTVSRVVDPQTLAEMPRGEIGEIVVAGPQVMRGYWQRPEADATVFFEREGFRFLRTGDLGWIDDDGYFHIVDRLKRMINVSSFKVWPSECEAALYQHPAIQECCVVSSPDVYRGETVKVFVVKRAGADITANGLIAWARGVMAAYKVPRIVAFVDRLPRSGSNKIDWRSLQAAEWEEKTSVTASAPPIAG